MDPSLRPLFADVDDATLTLLVREWSWLVPDGLRPRVASLFGDAWLTGADGAVHHLDVLEGQIVRVADGLDPWTAALRAPEERERALLEGLAMGCARRGLICGPNQCYQFDLPPVLGGPIDVDHVSVGPILPYHRFLARVHDAVRYAPAGSQVRRVDVEPDGRLTLTLVVDGAVTSVSSRH